MKRSFLGSRGQVFIGLIVIVFGFIGGAGLTFVTIFHTAANSNHVLTVSPGITPSPTPPQDNTIGLSASSGSPGTHLFLARKSALDILCSCPDIWIANSSKWHRLLWERQLPLWRGGWQLCLCIKCDGWNLDLGQLAFVWG